MAELPYHLREDSPPLGECMVCHRKSWSEDEVGTRCGMPQPDGHRCNGHIQRVAYLPDEEQGGS